MKRLASVSLGLLLALMVLPSKSAAKTKVELKDAQGKSVGEVLLWDQGTGVALQLKLHDLSPGSSRHSLPSGTQVRRPGLQIGWGTFQSRKKEARFR